MKDVLQVFSVLTDSFDSCKSHWRRDEWAAVSSRKIQKSSPSCDFWVPWHLPRWLYSWNYSELFSVYWCKQRYCKTSPDKALEQCPLNPQKQQSGQQSASLFDFFLIFFFAVNFTRHPLPLPRTWPPTQPWFFLFHRLPNIFLEEAVPGCFSMEYSHPPHQPLLSAGIIQRPSLSVSAFCQGFASSIPQINRG